MSRLLFWTPRVLSIVFILFISMFALDVFSEAHGFWRIAVALFMHLLPSLILLVALIVAWRWEWVGAVMFAAFATFDIVTTLRLHVATALKINWIMGISGPALLVATLFLVNWLKRKQLRHA